MMTETLRFFQVDAKGVNGIVNATEYRSSQGNKYTVTVINEHGHSTIPLSTREDAIECADNYIAQFAYKLLTAYHITT